MNRINRILTTGGDSSSPDKPQSSWWEQINPFNMTQAPDKNEPNEPSTPSTDKDTGPRFRTIKPPTHSIEPNSTKDDDIIPSWDTPHETDGKQTSSILNQQISSNQDNPPFTFNDYLKRIFNALGLSNEDQDPILKEFEKLTSKDVIINNMINKEFQSKLDQLIEADKKLKVLTKDIEQYNRDSGDSWKKLLTNLAKLQGYIFLNKVQSKDPKLVSAIIKAVSEKLAVVNDIFSNLKPNKSGTEEEIVNKDDSVHFNKYLKYKNKYLSSKKI